MFSFIFYVICSFLCISFGYGLYKNLKADTTTNKEIIDLEKYLIIAFVVCGFLSLYWVCMVLMLISYFRLVTLLYNVHFKK